MQSPNNDDTTFILVYRARGHTYFWFWSRRNWNLLVQSLLRLHEQPGSGFTLDEFSRVYRAAKKDLNDVHDE